MRISIKMRNYPTFNLDTNEVKEQCRFGVNCLDFPDTGLSIGKLNVGGRILQCMDHIGTWGYPSSK